jgi:hypothetical protein
MRRSNAKIRASSLICDNLWVEMSLAEPATVTRRRVVIWLPMWRVIRG